VKRFIPLVTLVATSTQSYANDDLELGVSLFTPSAFNLVAKGNIDNHHLSVSGNYLGDDAHGIQLGYSLLYRPGKGARSVDVVMGYSEVSYNEWTYVGLNATFQYGGFFIEPGISIGEGDFCNPQLLLQMGWLWSVK